MRNFIFASSLLLSLAACPGEKIVLHAQPLASADVQVSPLELYVDGEKLWVRVLVTNTSQGTITVQRDAMTAHLPNGTVIPRAMGTFGSVHTPYVLPPGGVHPVYVEFAAQGFDWKDVPTAQIDFTGAVTRDGQAVQVPPFVVAQ
jgi:hypothetical protein